MYINLTANYIALANHGKQALELCENNSFDLVTCITAIHNTKNPETAIKEIKRVSKKKVIVSILKKSPKLNNLIFLINKHLKGEFKDQGVDLVFFGKKE